MKEEIERKRVFLSFEVTEELKEKVSLLAKRKKVSRSEFIRNALFEYMNK
uniref:Ribbon-helix-helix protein CopG domain-containing protein n=1 Tax=uncultured prokaryote TaxID=198431 RepID=A0A0H5QF68_9ZZZZ|nr:hypothetical protein [uncultured prokaryote]